MGGVDIIQYRAAIGQYSINQLIFNLRKVTKSKKKFKVNFKWKLLFKILTITIIIHLLLACAGDIHPNPGPLYNLTISHTNIRSLSN